MSTGRFRTNLGLAAILLTSMVSAVHADELTFSVFPVVSEARTKETYAPLVRYLNRATGHNFKMITQNNFMSYWMAMKKGGYDLILDGPHLTDYRIRKMGYEVVAKYPAVASYTLASHEDVPILELNELIGHAIASPPSPSMGAIQIYKLFPNPLRQPQQMETGDSDQAAERVIERRADAAILPTPMLGRYPQLVPVYTTPQFPAPAFSVRGELSPAIKQGIKKALLDIGKSDDGKKALEAMNITAIEDTNAADFKGYMDLLEGMWGY